MFWMSLWPSLRVSGKLSSKPLPSFTCSPSFWILDVCPPVPLDPSSQPSLPRPWENHSKNRKLLGRGTPALLLENSGIHTSLLPLPQPMGFLSHQPRFLMSWDAIAHWSLSWGGLAPPYCPWADSSDSGGLDQGPGHQAEGQASPPKEALLSFPLCSSSLTSFLSLTSSGVLSSLIGPLDQSLGSRVDPHFTEEETEDQRGEAPCLRPHREWGWSQDPFPVLWAFLQTVPSCLEWAFQLLESGSKGWCRQRNWDSNSQHCQQVRPRVGSFAIVQAVQRWEMTAPHWLGLQSSRHRLLLLSGAWLHPVIWP